LKAAQKTMHDAQLIDIEGALEAALEALKSMLEIFR
jgi:hypothetical protein